MRRRCLVGLAWVTFCVTPALAAAQPSADALFAAIGVRPGATVCEIGAGDGALAIAAAKIVGPDGRVHASELGDSRVGRLRDRIAASGLAQIAVVAGSATGTSFPDDSCHAIFMRDVYHHFEAPAVMNAAIARALARGGRVGVVDFTPPPGSRAPSPADRDQDGMHGVHPETVTEELKAAGFSLASSEIGSRWFMLVFDRPERQATDAHRLDTETEATDSHRLDTDSFSVEPRSPDCGEPSRRSETVGDRRQKCEPRRGRETAGNSGGLSRAPWLAFRGGLRPPGSHKSVSNRCLIGGL